MATRNRGRGIVVVGMALAGVLMLGCASEVEEDPVVEDAASEVRTEDDESRWNPPLTIGGLFAVADFEPLWNDGRDCAGGLKASASELGSTLKATFPGKVRSLGGYNCRRSTGDSSKMSMHGTGRALDIHVRSIADGTAIADHLARSAGSLGVERIIWNKTMWVAIGVGSWSSKYEGSSEHTDHIHAELSSDD